MPTIQENYERWQQHKWAQGGHEWSPGRSAEGTAVLWSRTILPRIERHLPAGTILEIGPGFGRWTEFLRRHCERLIVVDLSERCIESCRRRFADDPRISYVVNDGSSFEMIPDGSVDFIFSFDSLVHAEADAIGAYVAQAARKLRPGGAGFIHHSNLGAFVDRHGRVAWFVTRQHWRGVSMSAERFDRQCREAGIQCRSQELINWLGRDPDADRYRLPGTCLPLIDCLSVFVNRPPSDDRPVRILNHSFVDEWRQAVWMADVYYRAWCSPSEIAPPARAPLSVPFRKAATAHRLWKSSGYRGVVKHAWRRTWCATDTLLSAGAARVTGKANRWFLHRRLLRQ